MKKNVFGRGFALALAVLLLLTGCSVAKPDDTTTVANATDVTADVTTAPAPDQTTAATEETRGRVEVKDIAFFSVNLTLHGGDNRYLLAYYNNDGTVYLEYVGDVKKIGQNMDAGVMDRIAEAVANSGIVELNGENIYLEGDDMGSAYIEYSDGTAIGLGYSGTIPQSYLSVYDKLDGVFQTLTAQLDVYIPVPVVMDGVDEAALAELLEIMENTQIRDLDMFQIADVAKDDAFALVMGLSSGAGVAKGTICSAMMMTTPYSVVIATLEGSANIDDIRADFVDNLDWQKWVCVMPTGALVAQKGNMVLCLMGADDLFAQTANAVAKCGWEKLEVINSPAMG